MIHIKNPKTTLPFLVVLFFFYKAGISQISDTIASSYPKLHNFSATCIGPTVHSGRVTDIDVNPNNTTEFFISYASGGLWYTNNNGITFEPRFQSEKVITIGDFDVDWDRGVIILGSGEQNSSRSSYAGNGIYKSLDFGKTWIHLGLEESHHISRVLLHPEDPNMIFIAALGHLYTQNSERGLYRSMDGGKSWEKVLFVNDSTGVIDILFHPKDPNVILAATWEKMRKAWNFDGCGTASNIYFSSDMGDNWNIITQDGSGFPTGEGKGRIGIDIAVHNDTTHIYAIVDNNHRRPKDVIKQNRIKGFDNEMLKTMSVADFLKQSDEDIAAYLANNGFHKKYNPNNIRKLLQERKTTIKDIYSYNDNANTNLFDTPVIGAEVYKSIDYGKTWVKTHKNYLDDIYYSYGYYFGRIHVHPSDYQKLYIYGVPLLSSTDGGATWRSLDADNLHVDHHSLWIDSKLDGHLISGNDGGLNISYDDGKNWLKCNNPAVGQYYTVQVDNQDNYFVYGGTQDNGVWSGTHNYEFSRNWEATGHYPYTMLLGGDGMQVQVDDRNPNLVYTGYQFGNYFRIDKSSMKRDFITPKHDLGDEPYRWNWQTPILLSPHNQDILYMGAHKLLRSMDKGQSFEEISFDLTDGMKSGNVPFGTITTLDESIFKFGLIYIGTDDGNVFLTKNGGDEWINLEIPSSSKWISRVQASKHVKERAFVSSNGYRDDDFLPYLFITNDYGQSWQKIGNGLPNAPINVVKEDPVHPEIVYVGNDLGLYISFNAGVDFTPFATENFPNVPVHDLVIQKKNKHLIIATHGRSLWKVDLNSIYLLKSSDYASLNILNIDHPVYNTNWGRINNVFTPIDTGFMSVQVYSEKRIEAAYNIYSKKQKVLAKGKITLKQGLSNYKIPLQVEPKLHHDFLKSIQDSDWYKNLKFSFSMPDDGLYYLTPGKYKFEIIVGQSIVNQDFEVTLK
ncbi:MAG: glycosyl hydrolase [Saprospiraceae bacterium]